MRATRSAAGTATSPAATLEPYYAVLSAAASIPDGLKSQWIALQAMRTNLRQNTDYYGNPPGWVPRLAVTTNYAAFQTIRQAASESLYFALRMADDYDALDQADELAARTTARSRRISTRCRNSCRRPIRESARRAYSSTRFRTSSTSRARTCWHSRTGPSSWPRAAFRNSAPTAPRCSWSAG